MPDHVPLARPADALSSAWVTRFHWFDAYYAVVGLGVIAFVLRSAQSRSAGLGAAGLLVAIALLYVLIGRRFMRDEETGWRGVTYLVLTFACYAAAVWLVSGASFALFALCPQCFMVLPSPAAVLPTIAFTGAHLVVFWIRDGDLSILLGDLLPTAVVIVVMSTIFGTWSQRILEQSQERAELIRALDASRAEVARLSTLAERQRLAGDIHDTIAQGLSSVVLLIQAARAEPDPARADGHLTLALDTARDNLDEARALVAALTPALLDGRSLVDAIRRLAPSTAVRGTVRPLSTGVDVVLLRAAQEALTNARKHAAAAGDVLLDYGAAAVTLSVCDAGPGFDPAAVPAGYGLAGMRARVAQVGGTLTVTSAPGAGTSVRVEVPA
ncbi:signal transduction histidine kinase [Asanoa ferruginea]|uniref:Oxygen sensor histidine kinase NreB n=1 Tax=Asanoa ferruginea TaxID=53367 RepID=A0A3D9ZXM8_9ACTN|nr:sensor histidine kinase [Asanoa ferruginea]REG01750.1 signal transduction histidine kinase [Asanoa ferruginea]GIF49217.1 two-component sensor histidine kinase [Asanoa ferruginea]